MKLKFLSLVRVEMEYNKRMFDYTFGVMDEFKRAVMDKTNTPEKVHFAWKTFMMMYKHARDISDVIDEEESALAQIVQDAEEDDDYEEEEDEDDEDDEDEDYHPPGEPEPPVEPEPAADPELTE